MPQYLKWRHKEFSRSKLNEFICLFEQMIPHEPPDKLITCLDLTRELFRFEHIGGLSSTVGLLCNNSTQSIGQMFGVNWEIDRTLPKDVCVLKSEQYIVTIVFSDRFCFPLKVGVTE